MEFRIKKNAIESKLHVKSFKNIMGIENVYGLENVKDKDLRESNVRG